MEHKSSKNLAAYNNYNYEDNKFCKFKQNSVNAIKNKELPEETKLPSIRTLSEDYNISRNTVTKAYSELEANGYIYSLSKSGFFVKNPSSTEPSLHSKEKSEDEGIPTVESIIKERKKEKTEETFPSVSNRACSGGLRGSCGGNCSVAVWKDA